MVDAKTLRDTLTKFIEKYGNLPVLIENTNGDEISLQSIEGMSQNFLGDSDSPNLDWFICLNTNQNTRQIVKEGDK